jgi:hypothetical protein
LKTVFYLSSALCHIHPILSLRYLKVWINPLERRFFGWLRGPGGLSARPGGLSARTSRGQPAELIVFLSSNVSLRGPIVLCPWEAIQNPLYPLDEDPLSLFIHMTQLHPLTLSSFPTDTTPHCPWSQGFGSSARSTAEEPLHKLQGPTPLDSNPLEALPFILGQEQGICNPPSISLLDAYLEECF